MKKLIAGLMLLLMFVNVASAVNGVAPDAKTLAQLKDIGKKYSKQVTWDSQTGWNYTNSGKIVGVSDIEACGIEIGYDGVLQKFLVRLPADDGDKNNVEIEYDIASGKPCWFFVEDYDRNPVRINGHYGCYKPNGDLLNTVDPNDNIALVR
ncbi:hypothetical protein AGMMS49532_06160 [Endomicrobiia bacterium]|nr:hypothetical protein AGMMS49532_06160 [Endomicrobiia bacterium]